MQPIELNKQLSELVEGDWVLLYTRYRVEVKQIKRTTPALIILGIDNLAGQSHDRKFNKKTGMEQGRGNAYYYDPFIKPYSEELWEREQQYKRYKKVNEKFQNVEQSDTEKVNFIYAFMIENQLTTPIN